ncbi:hypothetical protein EVJ58_g10753, partial [Rhodofomes roseus]
MLDSQAVLDRDTVSHIESNPPTYKSRVYAPTRPRFIIPEYGLEVAIGGCREFYGLDAHLHSFLKRTYGDDAVARIRMA